MYKKRKTLEEFDHDFTLFSVTGMMVNVWGIIPKWPHDDSYLQVGEILQLSQGNAGGKPIQEDWMCTLYTSIGSNRFISSSSSNNNNKHQNQNQHHQHYQHYQHYQHHHHQQQQHHHQQQQPQQQQ